MCRDLMPPLRRLAGLVLAPLLTFGSAAGAVVFDDGGLHVIDANQSFPDEAVVVSDSSDGAPTTLRVAGGGRIATAACAAVDPCEGLTASGSSVVEIRGGQIGGDVTLEDGATLFLAGGIVGPLRMRNAARLEVAGGSLAGLSLSGGVSATITGGRVLSFAAEALLTSALITGGEFLDFEVASPATITILGGRFRRGIALRRGARVNVAGGEWDDSLAVSEKATLSLLGTAFNFPFGDLSVALAGRLTGVLADGADLGVGFERDADSTIALTFADLTFADEDSDGEHDLTDHCPQSPGGQGVDAAGCTRDEFCAAIAVETRDAIPACLLADWKGDETATEPRDCRVLRRSLGELSCAATPWPE